MSTDITGKTFIDEEDIVEEQIIEVKPKEEKPHKKKKPELKKAKEAKEKVKTERVKVEKKEVRKEKLVPTEQPEDKLVQSRLFNENGSQIASLKMKVQENRQKTRPFLSRDVYFNFKEKNNFLYKKRCMLKMALRVVD